jgi:hypothetical protein
MKDLLVINRFVDKYCRYWEALTNFGVDDWEAHKDVLRITSNQKCEWIRKNTNLFFECWPEGRINTEVLNKIIDGVMQDRMDFAMLDIFDEPRFDSEYCKVH